MRRRGGFDAVVVLGARVTPSGAPSPSMRRRVARGVELFRRCGAEALLVSGGPPGAVPTEAELMRGLATLTGVPYDRVVVETTARTTLENADRCAEIIRDRSWSKVMVVTDALHLPRALLLFRAAGIRAAMRSAGWPPMRGAFWTLIGYEAAALFWSVLAVALRIRRKRLAARLNRGGGDFR